MRSDVETLSSALESIRDEVNQALKDLIESEIESGAGEVAVEAGRVLNAGGKRLRPIRFSSRINLQAVPTSMMSCPSLWRSN